MKLNNLVAKHAKMMKEKGWDEEKRSKAELHMLMITEIAEASEEVRGGKLSYYEEDGKPEGEAIELADLCLRIMHRFSDKGWDLDDAILGRRSVFHYHIEGYSPLEFHHRLAKIIILASEVEEKDCLAAIVHLCDLWCHAMSFPILLEDAIRGKMKYNQTRPYRHGGKKL